MANIEMWKPGLDDSAVSMDPNDPNFTNVNTALGGAGSLEKGLKNSGYIYGTPAAGATQLPTGIPFTAGASGWTPETLAEWQKTHNADGTPKLESLPNSFEDKSKQDLQDLQTLNASLGKMSDQDIYNMRSEAAGIVGGQFDPLINEAIEQKRQGMASSTVRAGQRGGFESTQIAGAAALAPIEGGNFVGQGGALERVKSAYDLNISNLQIKKQAAINEMFAALKKAKTDGDTAAFDRAMKLAEFAQKSEKDELDMKLQKLNLTQKTTEFGQSQNDRAVKNSVASLVTLDANGEVVRPSDAELQDFATKNKLDPMSLYAEVNKKIDDLNKLKREERKSALDAEQTRVNIEKTKFATEAEKQKLPLEIQKIQSDIRENQAQTAKLYKDLKETDGTEINQVFTGYTNLFGASDDKGNPKYYGKDGHLNTKIYTQTYNEFIESHKTNKDFYSKLFFLNLPPEKLLNPNDPTAVPMLNEAKRVANPINVIGGFNFSPGGSTTTGQ